MAVLIETSLGDITVDLFTEERPRSTLNFLKLCKIKYYNFSLFHSVQRNLVAQTGDPTGTGRGGQSVFAHLYGDQAVYFDMETVPRIKHRQKGLVSMVNNGNNGHGSQFFFTLGEDLDYLDGVHTVIGEVSEGMDVLDKINEAYCDEQHRPYKDIRIYHTIILDDPYADPEGLVVPDRSPEPTKEQLDSGRIGVDEDIDDTKGMTATEIQESMEKKEAQANAQILEMVGDLPDADVKPPDTVLFVCKLNPVTTSEDLEIIFSRFGAIKSCDVIKDQKSGESLQYAFIEFEKPEDCESAYFKMDNVLIDDRRIHVDFSQSVSKIRFEDVKGGGKGEMFGSKYRIKDNSKKDNKYDLVFEDGSGTNRQEPRDKGRREEHKRPTSRSRSRDRSPVRSKKERRHSRSPVRREGESKSSKRSPKRKQRCSSEERGQLLHAKDNKKRQKKRSASSDSSDDDRHRPREKLPSKDRKTRVDRSGFESDSDRDIRNSKPQSKPVDEYRKSENTRKQSSSDSDYNSKKSNKKKKNRDQSPIQSSYVSDERSKAKSRSDKSSPKKSKHKYSDSDSDSSHMKAKKRRADSRERTRNSKHDRRNRDKGRDRGSQERHARHRDSDRYRDSEVKEKRHKDRR